MIACIASQYLGAQHLMHPIQPPSLTHISEGVDESDVFRAQFRTNKHTLPVCPPSQEELIAEGVDEGDIFPISAATGQGVLPLVRRVRQVLDQLGPVEQVSTLMWRQR